MFICYVALTTFYSELSFSIESLLASVLVIFIPHLVQRQNTKLVKEPLKHVVFKEGYLLIEQHKINVNRINRVALSKTPQCATFALPYNYGNEGKLIDFNFPIGDYEPFKNYLSSHIPSVTFID